MSRNYATLYTAIWREDVWRQLSANAQRTYLLLSSQPDISAAGVLPLTIGRWAAMASNTTPASIRADLAELEAGRFLVVDYDHEELLVRTFIKWDKGYNNEKRQPVIRDAVAAVLSPILRASLVAELTRLGLPEDVMPKPRAVDRPSRSHSVETSEAIQNPASRETPNWDSPTSFVGYAQVNSLSDAHADTDGEGTSPSERVVVTKALVVTPQPTTHNPQPEVLAPASPDATPGQRAKAITDAYHAAEPMSKWVAVNQIVRKAIDLARWTDDQIRDAMLRLAEAGRSVTTDSLRIELDGMPRSSVVPFKPSTTDARVAEALAAGARVAAMLETRPA